jgi:hypothetical protein
MQNPPFRADFAFLNSHSHKPNSVPILPTEGGCKIENPAVALLLQSEVEGLPLEILGTLNFVLTFSEQNWRNNLSVAPITGWIKRHPRNFKEVR